jgi:hypothetical protein
MRRDEGAVDHLQAGVAIAKNKGIDVSFNIDILLMTVMNRRGCFVVASKEPLERI